MKQSDRKLLEDMKAMQREWQERDALDREYPQRVLHYMRLGFRYSQITRELVADDVRWEQAKKLPVDPNNGQDAFVKMKGWTYTPGILVDEPTRPKRTRPV